MNTELLKSSLKGTAVSVASLLILALLGAWASYLSADPEKLIAPLAYVIIIVSAFIGAVFTARTAEDPVPVALISAVTLIALHLLMHLAFGGELRFLTLLPVYGAILAASAAGALLFRRRTSRGNARTVKRMKRYSHNSRKK